MSVYFITCREQGICKIGYAQNPKSRRSSLQTASPAKLVLEATLSGGTEVERQLHQRFSEHRLKGEWFTITEELDALISEAAATTPEPAPKKARKSCPQLSDEEHVEKSLERDRRAFAEAMEAFKKLGPLPAFDAPPSRRFFTPAPVVGGQFNQHYGIRDGERRLLCADLGLTWQQADRLCDVFEEVRQRAILAAEREP